MNVVKVFVSLMILFVAVNFVIAIYRFLTRKWREGLENAGECPGSYCMDKGEDSVCHGSNKPCGSNPKAASDVPSSTPASLTASPNDVAMAIPPPPSAAQKRVFDDMVSKRGGITSDPLSNEGVLKPNNVPPSTPAGLCNASWEGKPGKPCLGSDCYELGEECNTNGVCKTGCCSRKDEMSPYLCVEAPNKSGESDQPSSGSSSPAVVEACDVLAIHNRSAHNSTYGQWFPDTVTNMNLSQTNYEHAGRKFLNEESIKKGIRTPLIMDSEAEVLGRLLWKVHLAAIAQNCMQNTPMSVKTTMRDELALMKKVHQIQNAAASSSLKGCNINSTCQPKQSTKCPTTGMMTARPSARENRPSATSSINSTVPTIFSKGVYTGYTTDYHPRNPNLKPKPYNSIWDLF